MPLLRQNGRNNSGKITVWSRGGGHKKKYKLVDLSYSLLNMPGVVLKLVHDPKRTCDLMLLLYQNGTTSFLLASKDSRPGDILTFKMIKHKSTLTPGNGGVLEHFPIGTSLFNVEASPGKGGKLARAAGVHARLLAKIIKDNYGKALLKLRSGEEYLVPLKSMGALGSASNPSWKSRNLEKAGRSRWMNRRPSVRGVAMNPVDHPHGGGEGKTSGGRSSVTFKGKITKGKKTRTRKDINNNIYKSRHRLK